MSNLIPFQFNNFTLESIDNDGEIWFIARPLAEFLGYKNPAEAIRDNVDSEDIATSYIPIKSANYILINESGLYSLILRSDKPDAKQFKKWVTSEVLPSIRKTGSYTMQQPALPANSIEIQIAESAARMLRMSETSKIRMLSKICDNHNVSSNFLPEYTDEQLTRALGDLLKDHGVMLSAVKANPILLELGLLEKLERRSSNGTKPFWSITEKGLQYGKNETPPGGSANETAPKWYVGKFGDVVRMIKTHLGESNVVSIV